MDIESISSLITSQGFPVAVSLALGWFVWKIFQKTTETNEKHMVQVQEAGKAREEKLYEELAESRKINGKFAEIISKYDVKLDNIQKDVEDIKNKIK